MSHVRDVHRMRAHLLGWRKLPEPMTLPPCLDTGQGVPLLHTPLGDRLSAGYVTAAIGARDRARGRFVLDDPGECRPFHRVCELPFEEGEPRW